MAKNIIVLTFVFIMMLISSGSVAAADTPVADFTASANSGSTPLSVNFIDKSTGNPNSWEWDFNNDGVIDSCQQNPIYTYKTPGNYSVKLKVTNTNGDNSILKKNSVNVANPLSNNRHIFIDVSNDEGIKFNYDGATYRGPSNTYYIKSDGGGLNALHITTDPNNQFGQVTAITATTTSPSGVFYLTDTGGRGFNDDIILLLSVKGPIPDNFSLRIRSSGYGNWTLAPFGVYNPPMPTNYLYMAGALDQVFTKNDFLYGPQTAKPGPGSLGTWSLPLYKGQNINDPSTAQYLMFIDLYRGTLKNSALIDGGSCKVEYWFSNLNNMAAFNMYGWTAASNQGQGISWTQDSSTSGYSIYVPIPVADFTVNTQSGVAPFTLNFKDASTGNITGWAWDFNNDGIIDSTAQNPTYTYSSPGTYSVKLTVSNAQGNDEEIKTDYITVKDVKVPIVTPVNVPVTVAATTTVKTAGNVGNTGNAQQVTAPAPTNTTSLNSYGNTPVETQGSGLLSYWWVIVIVMLLIVGGLLWFLLAARK